MSRERIMLTQAIPAVQQLRRVQGFDPLRFLKRNASGGIELEPRYQRLWFRLACPDGKMLLNRLQITDQIAVYEAQVFLSREDNQPITNFTAAVEKAQAPAGRYVQAAQDEALKTALDNAGFGIQLCEITPSATVDAQADGETGSRNGHCKSSGDCSGGKWSRSAAARRSYRRKSSGTGSAYTARGSTAGGGKDAQRKSARGSHHPADGKRFRRHESAAGVKRRNCGF